MNDQQIRASNLDQLLQTIKKEGIEQAHLEAEKIRSDAVEEGQRLISEAQELAQQTQAQTEAALAQTEAAMNQRLTMAARDLSLRLEEELVGRFRRFVSQQLSPTLDGDGLADFLAGLAGGFSSEQGLAPLEVSVNPAELAALEAALGQSFRTELGRDIELLGDPAVAAGLLIKEKGADYFFDFSAPKLAQLLSDHCGPRLKRYFREES